MRLMLLVVAVFLVGFLSGRNKPVHQRPDSDRSDRMAREATSQEKSPVSRGPTSITSEDESPKESIAEIPAADPMAWKAALGKIPSYLIRSEATSRQFAMDLWMRKVAPRFTEDLDQEEFEAWTIGLGRKEQQASREAPYQVGEFRYEVNGTFFPAKILLTFSSAFPKISEEFGECEDAELYIQDSAREWVEFSQDCDGISFRYYNADLVIEFDVEGVIAEDLGSRILISVPYVKSRNQAVVIQRRSTTFQAVPVSWRKVPHEERDRFRREFLEGVGVDEVVLPEVSN